VRFLKSFSGVVVGEIYPTQFKLGDDCPAELEDAALALDVLGDDAEIKKALAQKAKAEKAAAKSDDDSETEKTGE